VDAGVAEAMSYDDKHASALDQVRAKGAPLNFVSTASTYDPLTDRDTPGVTTTMEGFGIQDDSDPNLYERLGLIAALAVTVFWVPKVYGNIPPLGAPAAFGGVNGVVKSVDPLMPDGKAIAATVVISA
jgi:hypothetical protein